MTQPAFSKYLFPYGIKRIFHSLARARFFSVPYPGRLKSISLFCAVNPSLNNTVDKPVSLIPNLIITPNSLLLFAPIPGSLLRGLNLYSSTILLTLKKYPGQRISAGVKTDVAIRVKEGLKCGEFIKWPLPRNTKTRIGKSILVYIKPPRRSRAYTANSRLPLDSPAAH